MPSVLDLWGAKGCLGQCLQIELLEGSGVASWERYLVTPGHQNKQDVSSKKEKGKKSKKMSQVEVLRISSQFGTQQP